jgi:hypothetical protein
MSDKDITKEQKLSMVASRIRGVKVEKFSAELNIIEQNALETPEETIVASANKVIASAASQISALEAQYTLIQAE